MLTFRSLLSILCLQTKRKALWVDRGGAGKRADSKPKLSVLAMAVMMYVSLGEAWVTGWGAIGDWVGGKKSKGVKWGRGWEWRSEGRREVEIKDLYILLLHS